MMRRLRIFITTILVLAGFAGLRAESRWTYYGAYHNSLACFIAGDEVFSLCDGSIFSYSPADTEARVYNKATGLSDAGISHMAYSDARKCFVLVYSNSNIDVFYPDEEGVTNMPQLQNSSLADKTVNDLTIAGATAYVATNSGVSVINLARSEFSRTYSFDSKVNSAVELGGKIFAATAAGVMRGDMADNLLDPSKWTKISNISFSELRTFGGKLYAHAQNIFALDTVSGAIASVNSVRATFFCADNAEQMLFGNADGAYSMTTDGTVTKLCDTNDFKYLAYSGGTYWASRGFNGTQPYRLASSDGGTLQAAGSALILDSPIRNYCAFMNFAPSGRLLVAGGTLNYNLQNYDGTLYAYQNGHFMNFEDSVSVHTTYRYRNLTGVAEDPSDPTHVFATSGETGLYEFRNGRYVNHYDYTNSLLQTVLPSSSHAYLYVRTGGLQYDPSGNLWMLNDEVDTIIKILDPSGKWHRIYIDELAKYPTFDHLLFDNAGRAWFTHRRTTSSHHAGLACLNANGTLDDTSDDSFVFRYRFTNEDGTTYTPNTVDAIAKDNDGRIWVGTVEGPFVVDDPDTYFNTNFTFEQVKVPRNDGTDYADYLLTGVPITAIAIDAANRKWFGTNGDGIYLISANNIETVEHFTAANSPLVSDNIRSLAVNPESGELMIGTDKGLMGYQAGKVNADNKLKDKDLRIYPNPVRPDYYGDVTIEGLPMGAEVKITTTGGQLVRKGTASNGFYKWDVKDANGAGVGSGVYYVLAVSADGKNGARGRIVVVR